MLGDPASPLLWSINGDQPDERSLSVWCACTGQSTEEARDWGWLNALHPDDRENEREIWTHVTSAPGPLASMVRIRAYSQEYRSFKVLHIPLLNAARQVQGWCVSFIPDALSATLHDENWEIRLMHSMIFTQTTLGVFCLSLHGIILRINERFCQLTGYAQDELLTMTLWQLSLPADIDLHLQAMRERLLSGQSVPPFRTRYVRKDGSATWVRVTQFLVHQPAGEPYYFFYMVEDANEQVRAEEERAELLVRFQEAHMEALGRTKQLEAVFDAITDGVLVSDLEGNVIQTNATFKRLLHLDRNPEFLKLPFAERLRRLQPLDGNGEPFPLEQWPLTRVLRGESLPEGREGDILLTLPDGDKIYVNHTGTSIRDEQNRIVGAVLVIHDVNERHILESRIQKSFRILLALAEELVDLPERALQPAIHQQTGELSLPVPVHPVQTASEYLAELTCQMLEYRGVAISLLDPDTSNLRLVALAGFSAEEREFYYDTFSSANPADYLKESTLALLRQNEVAIEEFHYHPDDPRPYKVLLAPMIIEGRLLGVMTVEKADVNASYTSEEFGLAKAVAKLILLVIERERIQREWIESRTSELALREANRRFDEFLSIASHELRTPLAGIKGNLQLALRRLNALKSDQTHNLEQLAAKLNKIQDYLLQADHRINVQNRMISDFLDVSRIQANKLELVLAPCDLLQVVYEAVKDEQYTMPERVITLSMDSTDPLPVMGDADRLGQVIHNYLTNALKYSSSDQPVNVDIERTAFEARVAVHDRGPGLTPEEQQHIWERFYRVKGIPALSGAQGLGLGLHICRTIIEAHHGKFGLQSTPGEGSTFWFTLPLARSPLGTREHFSYALSEQAPETE
jgi:PAS domain S-box-containing protein